MFLSSCLFDFLWFSGQVLPGPWMTGHFSTIWPNGHPSLQSGHNWLKTSPPNYFCGVISHNNTFPKIIMTTLMMILWCRWSTDPAVPFPLPNASSSLSTPRQRSKIFENQHQHHQHQRHDNVLNFELFFRLLTYLPPLPTVTFKFWILMSEKKGQVARIGVRGGGFR